MSVGISQGLRWLKAACSACMWRHVGLDQNMAATACMLATGPVWSVPLAVCRRVKVMSHNVQSHCMQKIPCCPCPEVSEICTLRTVRTLPPIYICCRISPCQALTTQYTCHAQRLLTSTATRLFFMMLSTPRQCLEAASCPVSPKVVVKPTCRTRSQSLTFGSGCLLYQTLI